MTKPIQITIWVVIILAVGVIAYFLIVDNSETSSTNDDLEITYDDLEITYQECLDQGGEVVIHDSEVLPREGCPAGTEFLGKITDVKCFCSCCK